MTAPVSDGRSARLPSLTGLRWWAAMLVFLQHIALESTGYCLPGSTGRPVACTVAQKSFMHGFVGVACFFVLSGFLITTLLVREAQAHGSIDLFRFYLRRALRLLPALLAMLAVGMLGWRMGHNSSIRCRTGMRCHGSNEKEISHGRVSWQTR